MMDCIKDNLTNRFNTLYNKNSQVFFSPGRVNLIGEHTDYNNGFVMPFAINKGTFISIASRDDNIVNVYSENLDDSASFNIDEIKQELSNLWQNYIKGTINTIKQDFCSDIKGADIYIFSDLPFGAGLSSSASLNTALAYAYNEIYQLKISKIDLAKIAQKVEHEYIGTKCGLMDQMACLFSQQNAATMIDCNDNHYDNIPFELDNLSVLICDTNIKHNLADSAYNKRRQVCENIARFHSIKSLRELDSQKLEDTKLNFSEEDYKSALHVFTENQRVIEATKAMVAKDWQKLGKLMYQSHNSLKNDYKVSCDELDYLVELSQNFAGIYGARMTGGGFGGSTIHLLPTKFLKDYTSYLEKNYFEKFNIKPSFYISKACQGTCKL
ncbi:galactokinase [Francisella hispaniensis]|uniref:Galactokinase n=1 Tax=Francisella hispaniensis TaxID=622488 RepID=F4BJZ9_9GAMM|nr:galactokinase [Francisella hispaniensis]AEB28493.1 Galactokinase [Francisella hispaniensis]